MSITEQDLQQRIGQQDALANNDDTVSESGSLPVGQNHLRVVVDNEHQIDADSRLLPNQNPGDDDVPALQPDNKIRFSSLDFDSTKVSRGWRVLTAPLAFVRSVAIGGAIGAIAGTITGASVGGAGGTAAGGTAGAIAGALVGGVGAVPGAVGGAAAGGFTGAAGGATVGSIAGAGLGMAAGAGWGVASFGREAWTGDLADQLVAGGGWKSQGAHGQRAVTSLNRAGLFEDADFRREAQDHLTQVGDREWRKLLHVPKHYTTTSWLHGTLRKLRIRSAEPGIESAADRQKVREAVMLYVAKHGKAGAADYRARLLKLGNQNPKALQTEITKLKAGILAKQVDAAADHTQLNKIIQRNPDVFAHAQTNPDLTTDPAYNALSDFRGMQSIFGVVDRLNAQGGVTQADRDDLIAAFKTAGVDDPPDLLAKHVGKPMTPAIRHQIAQAFSRHMIAPDGDKLFNVSQDAGDNLRLRRRIVDALQAKHYDEANNDVERDTRSRAEMQFLKDKVNDYYRVEFNNGDASTKARIGAHLRALEHSFETSAQRGHRLQRPDQVRQPQQPEETEDARKVRFQDLFSNFAPAGGGRPTGDAFGDIQHTIGLTDDDLKQSLGQGRTLGSELRHAIAARFTFTWGQGGRDLPPPGADDAQLRRNMEREALIAISNYFDRNPDALGAQRSNTLKDDAAQAAQDSTASRIDRAKAHYRLGADTFNPAGDQIDANNGRNLATIVDRLALRKTDLPSDIQQKIDQTVTAQVTQNRTPAQLHDAVSELIATEALALANSDHAGFAQQQRAVYAGTRHAAEHEDNAGSFLRGNNAITRGISAIVERHTGSYWGDSLSAQKKQIYQGPPSSYATNDVDRMQGNDFVQRRHQVVGNLRSTMQGIIGSKQNNDARQAAIQRVPPKVRQLLATIAQGASDGNGDDHAKAAVLNGFVLRNLIPGLTVSGDRAKQLGVWDQGDRHSRNHAANQDSLQYIGKLANGVFTRSGNSLKVAEDGFGDRSKPLAANPQIQQIENERASWFDPAEQFLQQLVQSGQALNNPPQPSQNA